MVKGYVIFLQATLFIFSLAAPLLAAQSTIDVPASDALKASVRSEILGAAASKNKTEPEYRIGHGDILSVSIFEEGDMAASYAAPAREGSGDAPRGATLGVPVRMDGRISLKHIGDIEVVGMTLTELADYLKKLYATIYADPIVTTTLQQSNSLRYTVMGNVAGPGIFFLDFPMTIVQTIARSGGFTEWANKKVTVVRKELKEGDGQRFKNNTLQFDYDDFIAGKNLDKNIYLKAGDIIIVQ